MSTEEVFDLRNLGPTPADYEFARELYRDGVSIQTIRQRLLQSGLKSEHTETAILDIAGEDVQSLVVAGSSHQIIFNRLMPRGMNEHDVKAVVERLMTRTDRRIKSAARGPRDKYDLSRTLMGQVIRWLGRKLRILG